MNATTATAANTDSAARIIFNRKFNEYKEKSHNEFRGCFNTVFSTMAVVSVSKGFLTTGLCENVEFIIGKTDTGMHMLYQKNGVVHWIRDRYESAPIDIHNLVRLIDTFNSYM
jgi:hypothetical protein